MAENKEPKPEPPQAEERHIGFRQRWLRLVEEAFEKRRAQERGGTPIFPAAHAGIYFQAAIIALIDTLAQRRRHKARHKTGEGET
ncbi:MAG TPA: hypothetical protein G4O03_05760 [Dehalococcoidia bacterium]|nr:hypothetical protein [Dehalococcoidia bacterium]